MSLVTTPPVPITAGVLAQLGIPNGPWSIAVVANLTGMALVMDSGRWLAPFTADLFGVGAATPVLTVVPVNVGGATTGHLLVTFYEVSEVPTFGQAYPLLMPLAAAE